MDDEALFFRIKKETAINVLRCVGVNEEEPEKTYQELTNKSTYDSLVRKGKINPNDEKILKKYN